MNKLKASINESKKKPPKTKTKQKNTAKKSQTTTN